MHLNSAERIYSQLEHEALAIIYGVENSMRTFMDKNSYSMLKNVSQTWLHQESKGGHSPLWDIGMTFATKLEQVWEMLMP